MEQSKFIMKWFLTIYAGHAAFISRTIVCVKILLFIQTKFRNSISTHEAKIEVLTNYWDKLIGQIYQRAFKVKDSGIQDLLKKIILIPPKVRRTVLSYYLQKCENFHSIAFL